MCVLDSARNNLGFKCGVVFHGLLSPFTDYVNVDPIQTKLLVCYGDLDTNSSNEEIDGLLDELRERHCDFQVCGQYFQC
jgi:dienelactone hydrolase